MPNDTTPSKPAVKTPTKKPSDGRVVKWTQRILGRTIGITFIVGGIVTGLVLANELEDQPRTEDAYVRANVIGIAAHVSGEILELNVVDNQPIKEGDLLFVVDPRPYEIALMEAEAQLDLVELQISGYQDSILAAKATVKAAEAKILEKQALADYAIQYVARVEPLLGSRFVTPNQVVEAQAEAAATEAAVSVARAELVAAQQEVKVSITQLGNIGEINALRTAAQVEVDNAKLFLNYCYVRAPFEGYITNLNISVGEYANEGQEVFAVVDSEIWYVMANFKETYLAYLEPGMTVEIYLMAFPEARFKGKIQGIGWAITDSEGPTLSPIPTTSPTLDWVRLAQRFPVRITVEDDPDNFPLRMGATAAVIVLPEEDQLPKPRFPWIRDLFQRFDLVD
ncbi:MAG: HlyD family efflux transporter periplasmic adaptor subunit [Phycisphaerales bacterium]|jgi:multidrug efflux system membrane fusion protein|nr:HlyD family efflux transporter periplasmic adaptor subunit [Phycisphaerales bacterium]